MNRAALITVAYACCAALPAHAGSCEVASGPGTAALVELYTSEGCSSCPPADRALQQLRRSAGVDSVVIPLGLHVGYWDQIGWKDVFAQKPFEARQALLVARGRSGGFVYTPQFFVGGKELRTWRNALPDAIRKINVRPAQASITLKWTEGPGRTVVLEASGAGQEGSDDSALYVAVSESQLVSHVLRGENSNTTLTHDDTVRDWSGPVKLLHGHAQLQRQFTVPDDWKLQHLRAVAFVQDMRSGAVLQAVSTASCYQAKAR